MYYIVYFGGGVFKRLCVCVCTHTSGPSKRTAHNLQRTAVWADGRSAGVIELCGYFAVLMFWLRSFRFIVYTVMFYIYPIYISNKVIQYGMLLSELLLKLHYLLILCMYVFTSTYLHIVSTDQTEKWDVHADVCCMLVTCRSIYRHILRN